MVEISTSCRTFVFSSDSYRTVFVLANYGLHGKWWLSRDGICMQNDLGNWISAPKMRFLKLREKKHNKLSFRVSCSYIKRVFVWRHVSKKMLSQTGGEGYSSSQSIFQFQFEWKIHVVCALWSASKGICIEVKLNNLWSFEWICFQRWINWNKKYYCWNVYSNKFSKWK